MQHNFQTDMANDNVAVREPPVCELEFSSNGDICRALHYPPAGNSLETATGTPCVVLAHGFGGTRSAGLAAYAEAFSASGLHAFTFDYRHFGTSGGQPRQLISIKRQIADWHAAIAAARSLPGVDPDRIVLWGVSFSGGHVLRVAARDHRIGAVIAQFPMLDGLAALLNIRRYAGYGQVFRLLHAGLTDLASILLRRSPVMLPIVAAPGQLAAMSTADAEPGYLSIASDDWQNAICARIALTVPWYRPGFELRRMQCPVYIQIAVQDSILPPASLERFIPRGESRVSVDRYPLKHFDAFAGEGFDNCIADQLSYLMDTLKRDVR